MNPSRSSACACRRRASSSARPSARRAATAASRSETACRSARAARDHLLGVEALPDHLQRHEPADRLILPGQIDDTTPPGADPADQPVTPDHLAGGPLGQGLGPRTPERRRAEETARGLETAQQGLDTGPLVRVAGTGTLEMGGTFGGRQFGSLGEDLVVPFDRSGSSSPPGFLRAGTDQPFLSRCTSLKSHARA